ncbi:altronate hydrolase [Chania multitudinisentens RB-25]|uniref:Altronate hydrolase n=1 Tax=Chania multitudinisentens RB-25 TaxID=1441930 RepID=W0LCE3_9GAMM|nr:altronate dehydratase family protein [Chania multitudinisentens]AHG21523.1 altronate hydrolase [Chania multitudinisentens RB-25]
MQKILKIDESDNLIVALKNLNKGETVCWGTENITLVTDVKAKHKFSTEDIATDGIVSMYGTPVGKATKPIAKGEAVTVNNIKHYAAPVLLNNEPYHWQEPDISAYATRTFKGYMRDDGRVGTANYWLVLPLVFCENRNVTKLTDALNDALGYSDHSLTRFAMDLAGDSASKGKDKEKLLPHIEGVRCITVNSGCGGATTDSMTMCDVLAAYADHPNVIGITVFSLGCEKARVIDFQHALNKRNPNFDKPALYFKQQEWENEEQMMQSALRETFSQMKAVGRTPRVDVPLSFLKLGVKCGASDGFSGISGNPAMGLVSDWVVTLGGASGLAEFPELCGAEGDMVKRCRNPADKKKFLELMNNYEKTANFFDTSIADNPSPGNIADGLITDAIKSTGAAKKGGRAPISAVCDYAEPMPDAGLSLVCTPGNDVVAVTGLVAAGCNIVIFSTGLGTPTGNPIVPVLKISTNTEIAERLKDIIDFDCGSVIEGTPLHDVSQALFERVIETASRDYIVKSDRLEQYDFLLWKRSLDL